MANPFGDLLDFDKPKRSADPAAIMADVQASKVPPRWDHQEQTYQHALSNDRVLDFSDPGTGKTRAHADVFRERLEKSQTDKLLVLAPKTLLENAWKDDINEFQPDLKCSIAWAENRDEAFNADADVFITNVDAVKYLAKQSKTWFSKRFGRRPTLIIDELTAYKHQTSARSKAAQKVTGYFPFRAGLTATPDPNSVLELWHQALLIDDGERLGNRFFKYRSAVAEPVQTGPKAEHISWVDKEGIEDAVGLLLADITIRHAFEDCMDIPPNLTRMIRFDLPRKLQQQYDEMEMKSILALEDGEIVGINAASRANKLLQIASGAAYDGGAKGSYRMLDDTRYQIVADLVEQSRHSVTFYNWHHQKDELAKVLKQRGVEYVLLDSSVSNKRRGEIRRAYQRGDFQTVLLHPQTGAHGLTLTKGTTTIWSSPVYQSDFMKQGKHRIYRGGQTKKTYTKCVSANNTIDEGVYTKAELKTKRMDTFLGLLRESKQ